MGLQPGFVVPVFGHDDVGQSQGQYAVGFKTGKWKQWNASGNLVAEGDYRSGRLVAGAPVAAMAGCERVATK